MFPEVPPHRELDMARFAEARGAGRENPLTADRCAKIVRIVKISAVIICAVGLGFSLLGSGSTSRVINVAEQLGKEPDVFGFDITVSKIGSVANPVLFTLIMIPLLAEAANLI